MKAEQTLHSKELQQLIQDVKWNGIGYVKSSIVVNEIRKLDSSVQITWCREDQSYKLTYNKGDHSNG